MTREFDRACEQQLEDLERTIESQRTPASRLVPHGACYYCAEVIALPKLFCDAECGHSFEYERSRRSNRHRIG